VALNALFDWQGIVHCELIPEVATVNEEKYKMLIHPQSAICVEHPTHVRVQRLSLGEEKYNFITFILRNSAAGLAVGPAIFSSTLVVCCVSLQRNEQEMQTIYIQPRNYRR
jgi:hypothetical protein